MTSNGKHKKLPVSAQEIQKSAKWLILGAVAIVFASLLYPSLLIKEKNYNLGDISGKDIKASLDFFIEDHAATLKSRKQAVDQVLTVYDYDPRISQKLLVKIRNAFSETRKKTEQAKDRKSAIPNEIQASRAKVDREAMAPAQKGGLLTYKDPFETHLGVSISEGAFNLLIKEQFSTYIANTISSIVDEIQTNGIVANKEVLLKELERGIILRDVSDKTETAILSLRQYHGPDQAKTMVRIVGEPLVKNLNYNLVNLIVDIAQRMLQPNITLNRNETEERKKKTLKTIKPVMYQIKAGEMILREGERVNQVQLLKLQSMREKEQTQEKNIPFSGIGAALLLSIFLICSYTIYLNQPHYAELKQSRHLLFMGLTLIMVFFFVKMASVISTGLSLRSIINIPEGAIIYAAPVAAGAMLICLFLGFRIAVPFSLATAICAALLLDHQLETFLFFSINNSMAAYWITHCRERTLFIKAGAKLGLLNMVIVSFICIYTSAYGWNNLTWSLSFAFLGGVTSAFVVLGLAPLVELVFRYTTDITLMELSNLDRPILRRLMLEAPGTYHHSVVVGSLVEAAATEIGAKPLLAKVCGYYHDIGKVKKPLYFIENQIAGHNKHDKLAPSMSSLILIAHVKDGVEIAKKHKLGQSIIDTIQQHHGTSLIHYFYEKAKQLRGEDTVKIEDFSYHGPKPQTKEAGLVMLADVVEAASRTLDNPTPARIQGMVQHLINKVFSDGQLDNCELTLKDLHSIAKSFNKILYGIHHHRIEYTESPSKEDGKSKNAGTDRQSTIKSAHKDPTHSKESPSRLKRLGLS
ncbi:MAG: HDIG domain-containing protein [Desulfobacteraceae bacterium]|nr:HDIG domain-containing protein [Desulfobacteraceae bacterium]